MRITEVTASNFKLAGFTHELDPMTVFTGANGTGKSAVPESILLCALGTIPGGRYSQVRAIYERYAPDQTAPMSVQMIMKNGGDDYIELNREIKLKSGGTAVTQEIHFRGEKGGSKKMQALIDPSIGLSAEVIDFSIFEGMSPAEQKRFLFSLVSDPEGFDREEIRKQLSNVLLETTAPEPEPEFGSAESDKGEWNEEEFGVELMPIVDKVMKGWDSTSSVTDNLVRIDKIARDMKSSAVQRKKDLVAQVKGALLQTTDEKPPISGPIGELRKRFEELTAREKELIAEIATEKARVKAHADWFTDNQTFQANLEQAQDRLAKVQEEERDANIDAEIEEREEKCQHPDWINEKKSEAKELKNKISTLSTEHNNENGSHIDAQRDTLNIKGILTKISLDQPICPISGDVCDVDWDIPEWEAKLKKAKAHEEDCAENVVIAQDRFDEATSDLAEINDDLRDEENFSKGAAQQIENLYKKKKMLAGAVTQWKESVESAQAQYDRHIENDARIVADDKTTELETDRNEVVMQMADHSLSLMILEKRKLAETNRLTFQRDQLEAKEMEVLTSALVEKTGPAGILGDALRASLSPVVDEINNFLPTGYEIEITPAGGDLSVLFSKEGEQARSFNAISTGEMSILATVCAIVFMNRKGAKLRLLIIDRMESIYIDQRKMLLETIQKAIDDGNLDNFIGGYVGEPTTSGCQGLANVIHLEAR